MLKLELDVESELLIIILDLIKTPEDGCKDPV